MECGPIDKSGRQVLLVRRSEWTRALKSNQANCELDLHSLARVFAIEVFMTDHRHVVTIEQKDVWTNLWREPEGIS